MNKSFIFLFCILWAGVAQADSLVQNISLEKNPSAKLEQDATHGTVLTFSSSSQDKTPHSFPIVVIQTPAITQPHYAISGYVRYHGVAEGGLLQLWNHFGAQGSFFSQTAGNGPMAPLKGDSDWRQFILPFDSSSPTGTLSPTKLELNLVLSGSGTVSVSGLELHQFPANVDPTKELMAH